MKKQLLALLTVFCLHLPAQELTVDPAASRIRFGVQYRMTGRAEGSFGTFEGTLAVEGGTLAAAKAVVQATSVDTANTRRDNHLRNSDFFDVEKFPAITFESVKVAEGKLTGNLTMLETTREIVLDIGEQGWSTLEDGRRVYRLKASGQISRFDWGLRWNRILEAGGVSVGELVDISIDIVAATP